MKVGIVGIEAAEGKVRFSDQRLQDLEKKLSPKKTHHFFVELTTQNLDTAHILVCLRSKVLDILISDLERLEGNIGSQEADSTKQLFKRCVEALEKETPLCDMSFSTEEESIIKEFQFLSKKPVLIVDEQPDNIETLLTQAFRKAETVFFYTIARGELKSWSVAKGTSIVEAAAKIHTDLARGFIKAEVVRFNDFMQCHNIQEAKTKNQVLLVGRDYIVEDGDIIEIKFNV